MNPVGEIKNALNVGNIVKFAAGTYVLFFILDLAGILPWFLAPFTTLRANFGKSTGS